MVGSEAAAAHLKALSREDVGYRAVSDCTGIEPRVIQKIRNGTKAWIRMSTEQRILAVTKAAGSAGATTPAGPTLRLVEAMLRAGYTREAIAEAMGYQTLKLQWLRRKRITVATKVRVEAVYQRLMEDAA